MHATDNEKATVVVGLGATGLACLRFLRARGKLVAATDSRSDPPGLDALRTLDAAMPLTLGGFDSAQLLSADEIVVSPGVSVNEPALREARASGVSVIGEIELFARYVNAPVVAITGSNGKSTVTTLLARMCVAHGLDVAVGGNLGTPALDLLRDPAPWGYVLELSSFQLETTTSLRPLASVVLNISSDHMDRHGSVEAYAAIKARLYDGDGLMLLNADDPLVVAMGRAGRKQVCFSAQPPSRAEDYGLLETSDGIWLLRGETRLMHAGDLRLRGLHNLTNVLAALALGDALDLPLQSSLEAVRGFAGLPHRTQWVASSKGVHWYNDSKATNVGAACAAVAGMPGPLVLILGGDGKGADFSPLRQALRAGVRAVVLIGRDAPLIERALQAVVPAVSASTMDDAVRRAAELAQPGDTVLLSPACASFDMYSGYEERGRAFEAAVGRCTS